MRNQHQRSFSKRNFNVKTASIGGTSHYLLLCLTACTDGLSSEGVCLRIADDGAAKHRTLENARSICRQQNATLPVIYDNNTIDRIIKFLSETYFYNNSTFLFVSVCTDSPHLVSIEICVKCGGIYGRTPSIT